jgi:hypothetical protein
MMDGKMHNSRIKKRIHFLKKKTKFVLSMWKLTLSYGTLYALTKKKQNPTPPSYHNQGFFYDFLV